MERREADTRGLADRVAGLERRLPGREQGMRQVAHALKICFDQLRDQLATQIEENTALRLEVARLTVELGATREHAAVAQGIQQSYSDALTMLLCPDSPADL